MFTLRSAIDTFPEMIDYRHLVMECEFYGLSMDAADGLIISFMGFIRDFLGDQSVCTWISDPHIFRVEKNMDMLCGKEELFLAADGAVCGKKIKTKTHFRRWEREICYPRFPMHVQGIPSDYADYWRDLTSAANAGKKDWKEVIMELFSVPGKVPYLPFLEHEISIRIKKHPSNVEPGKTDGWLEFSVPAFCLDENCNEAANEMADYWRNLSLFVPSFNARVMLTGRYSLTTKGSPYITYFGSLPEEKEPPLPHGFTIYNCDWMYTHYLAGAEWFNVVSPLALEKLPNIRADVERYPGLKAEFLKNGSMCIRCQKEILDVDIHDLEPMKRVLYGALVPGMSTLSIDHFCDFWIEAYWAKPRMLWDRVPIFEDEIMVKEGKIILSHK